MNNLSNTGRRTSALLSSPSLRPILNPSISHYHQYHPNPRPITLLSSLEKQKLPTQTKTAAALQQQQQHQTPIKISSSSFTTTTHTMSSNEAIQAAQSRAQDAAKSTDHTDAHGDVATSVQEASGENSAPHAHGSGMKAAGERLHGEGENEGGKKKPAGAAGGDGEGQKDGDGAKDRVEGIGSSSS